MAYIGRVTFSGYSTNANLTGTISSQSCKLCDTATVIGDLTITDHLVLAKVIDISRIVSNDPGIVLSNDSSSRTITGAGSLQSGTIF